MPQEHHVVRCYKCETFQVQIVKKVKKFECKLCGEKQSLKKEYGRGTGKDCRTHVQKLRDLQIQNESKVKDSLTNIEDEHDCDSQEFKKDFVVEQDSQNSSNEQYQKSKWSDFISKEETPADEDVDPEYAQYTFERPTKRKRNDFTNTKTKQTSKNSRRNKETHDFQLDNFDSFEEPMQNKLPTKLTESNQNNNTPNQDLVGQESLDIDSETCHIPKKSYEQKITKKKNNLSIKVSKWNNFISTEEQEVQNLDENPINNEPQSFDPKNIEKRNNSRTKVSKWNNFITTKSQKSDVDDNPINAEPQITDEIKVCDNVKSIFKTNDDDLDDILDF